MCLHFRLDFAAAAVKILPLPRTHGHWPIPDLTLDPTTSPWSINSHKRFCVLFTYNYTMSPRTSSDSERVISQPMHTMVSGMSNLASRSIQDDEMSSHDNSSLCSSIRTAHGNPQDMKNWTLNHPESFDQKTDPSEVHMLSFSLSQQLMTPTVGPNDVMYPVDFPAVPDMNEHEMSRDIYSTFLDFSSVENDSCARNGTPDDALSIGHSSHTDDGHYITESWTPMMHGAHYPGTTMEQFSSGLYQTVPVSPPLTEASNDMSVASCSHPGFPSFMAPDDALLQGDFTTSPIGAHGINPAEPLFPSTSLNERDLNRTIRPSKQSRRSALPAVSHKADPEFFPSLPVREPTRQKSKEGVEARNPREHQYYSMSTHSDGKYYCPFATGDKPCNHPPTTQKCAYQQPYRCKVPACIDAQLRFSSNACLFRHEREAHGLHGHGDNPHLCLWEGCERAVPGNGFPRRWNLYDHMRRVHDYATSERHSSPETSPGAGQIKKKETAGRKRRVTGATPAPTMKRTRSIHSQASSIKATQTSIGQRLQTAESNYFKCRSRLMEQMGSISPQDNAGHEKLNASFQELFTLSLNIRQIEASQAVNHVTNGMPSA
ncbi:unnamed protein product [Penicillium salamii]|uniref:C2H2 finger domain protein n=1 Tax=Penicillium salamii TaxID=1612424 RepID=A0A9W4JRT1_9EURO|nr:unnamed protein product [Penicillium salamii]CAG8190008.1 unnamed protein product [Penicillium salamii]CAG8248048.1 unnamed protein product [Penicillium salamii]CAG8252780.1 unnamed protein product [Penicillium salamii]CAG8275119.1 unnamed protein product [Penicillium salamii]